MIDGIFIEIMPETGWRLMLGLAALPAIVMFYGFLTLPESPRWLAQNGRIAEADNVLQSLRESDQDGADELAEIVESVAIHREEGDSDVDDDENIVAEEDEVEDETEYGTSPGISTPHPHQHHHRGVVHRFISMISDRPTRRALFLGCGLMVVQQCSGINT